MRKIFAIQLVLLKSLLHSRFILVLGAALAVCVLILPMMLHGDGTPSGRASLILSYNLLAALIILGTATMWISCGSISSEISGKQIQMVLCKPVNAAQIWLGKFTGILIVNSVLLGFCAMFTFLLVQRIASATPGASAQPVEALNCRMLLQSVAPPLDADVADRIKLLRQQGSIPPDIQNNEVLEDIRRQIISERKVLKAGSSRDWKFHFTSSPEPGSLTLSYRFEPVVRDTFTSRGIWSVLTSEGKTLWSFETNSPLDGTSSIIIPSAVIIPEGEILLRYQNPEGGRTLIFSDDVNFLYTESSFGMNITRAALMLLATLTLLTAIGLSMGSLLSFPVALFSSATILLIALIIQFFVQYENMFQFTHEGEKAETTLFDRYGSVAMHGLNTVIAPATRYRPLSLLSNGIMISNSDTMNAVAVKGLLYPALLCLATSWLLSRRQVALPDIS